MSGGWRMADGEPSALQRDGPEQCRCVAGNRPGLPLKGVIVKQGYRLIVVDKDGVLVAEFQLTEQALAAPEAFVTALKDSVEAIEEAEP